jgi:phosphoglycerol transferase MdoB-like AlkP superfamily enzyme
MGFARRIASHRLGGVAGVALLVVGIATATRLALLVRARAALDASPGALAAVLGAGLVYDLAAASYLALPVLLYLVALPQRIFASRAHRVLATALCFALAYALLFAAVAEWLFWGEFGTRFNFIAVDYLVYTRELLDDIWESYAVAQILAALVPAAALVLLVGWRSGWLAAWSSSRTPLRSRLAWGAALALIPLGFALALDDRTLVRSDNRYQQELARDGLHALFAALRSRELPYATLYPALEPEQAFRRMREALASDAGAFVSDDPRDLRRRIAPAGAERRYNVIQITVESLSAKYLAAFGARDGLTPNLDAIAAQGILLTNLYATGTRTVRGMEALALSVPPTPGESLVKRPRNEELFSIGPLFGARGYDVVFLYGGYAYFDNMAHFFAHNGFRVVDRSSVSPERIAFANAWGASDEDLYGWVLGEADRAHAAGRPFFHFVMTTSNHRPFTYPSGRIDIPPHTNRDGGVKYSDWAIARFLDHARERPWFANTIFAIVADHCASSTGRADLPIRRYQIPLILYAPGLLAPRRVDRLASPIDVAPTLLALLNWRYDTAFYGKDVLAMQPADERALVATYETLGFLKDGRLVVLKPGRPPALYRYDRRSGELAPAPPDRELVDEAIAYYQTADALVATRGVGTR